MLPRLPPLLGLSLILAGLAHAAPAPLRKDRPEQPPVELRGWLRQRPVGEPCAITCQADWQTVAKAWGIHDPPRVDFRTHFLAVHVWAGYGTVSFRADGEGDLRVINSVINEVAMILPLRPHIRGPCYLIKSFRRCDVKTVNGLPLPRP